MVTSTCLEHGLCSVSESCRTYLVKTICSQGLAAPVPAADRVKLSHCQLPMPEHADALKGIHLFSLQYVTAGKRARAWGNRIFPAN